MSNTLRSFKYFFSQNSQNMAFFTKLKVAGAGELQNVSE